jgi:hypothetical protein
MAESADKDREHLKLLSLFHYVVGTLIGFFSSFFIIHALLGIAFITRPELITDESGTAPPAFIGWVFALLGSSVVLFGWIIAVCMIAAGRFLIRRRHYTFCLVTAAASCLFAPFGTVLGIFTIIVLSRSSVKELFA